jgi:hypothetical protein
VCSNSFEQPESSRQFLGDHLLRVVTLHHMNLMRSRVEIVEQALCVKRTAGTGDGNEYFQTIGFRRVKVCPPRGRPTSVIVCAELSMDESA